MEVRDALMSILTAFKTESETQDPKPETQNPETLKRNPDGGPYLPLNVRYSPGAYSAAAVLDYSFHCVSCVYAHRLRELSRCLCPPPFRSPQS